MDETSTPRADVPSAPKPAQPAAIVIFGASGDLTCRKLLPALYEDWREGMLGQGTAVVGVSRSEMTDDAFRDKVRTSLKEAHHEGRPVDEGALTEFAKAASYIAGSFEDPATYRRLAERLAALDKERGIGGNRLFYLATPPVAFPVIVKNLAAPQLVNRAWDGPWTRIIVEKPFGHDGASARALNNTVGEVFREDQIYRIDHYLGKETVQNILVLRLGNGIFEPLWNRRYVDQVQITVAESLGVEGRAGYFEDAGIVRDIVQNHLLQLLTLTAMEPTASFTPDSVRNEKVKVLRAIHVPTPDEVRTDIARGQYGPGVIDGKQVPGYRQEPGVKPDSMTDTYVALKLRIENWRWAGVPFYLRAGKRLPKRVTEIAICFKPAPHSIFRSTGRAAKEPNVLALRIQPNEGISLSFGAKMPGSEIRIDPVQMDFRYSAAFGTEPPEAYERLLHDALVGDSTLFARRDEVEGAWVIVDAIVEGWRQGPEPEFPNYAAGTWNPEEAVELLTRDHRWWRKL